ncbi:hypothetical protein DFH06DRAFT_1472835 [Mycena polygramma]|nr:hypothetical protein DFH06DRAFT_1472835 [Mycena polygramma]
MPCSRDAGTRLLDLTGSDCVTLLGAVVDAAIQSGLALATPHSASTTTRRLLTITITYSAAVQVWDVGGVGVDKVLTLPIPSPPSAASASATKTRTPAAFDSSLDGDACGASSRICPAGAEREEWRRRRRRRRRIGAILEARTSVGCFVCVAEGCARMGCGYRFGASMEMETVPASAVGATSRSGSPTIEHDRTGIEDVDAHAHLAPSARLSWDVDCAARSAMHVCGERRWRCSGIMRYPHSRQAGGPRAISRQWRCAVAAIGCDLRGATAVLSALAMGAAIFGRVARAAGRGTLRGSSRPLAAGCACLQGIDAAWTPHALYVYALSAGLVVASPSLSSFSASTARDGCGGKGACALPTPRPHSSSLHGPLCASYKSSPRRRSLCRILHRPPSLTYLEPTYTLPHAAPRLRRLPASQPSSPLQTCAAPLTPSSALHGRLLAFLAPPLILAFLAPTPTVPLLPAHDTAPLATWGRTIGRFFSRSAPAARALSARVFAGGSPPLASTITGGAEAGRATCASSISRRCSSGTAGEFEMCTPSRLGAHPSADQRSPGRGRACFPSDVMGWVWASGDYGPEEALLQPAHLHALCREQTWRRLRVREMGNLSCSRREGGRHLRGRVWDADGAAEREWGRAGNGGACTCADAAPSPSARRRGRAAAHIAAIAFVPPAAKLRSPTSPALSSPSSNRGAPSGVREVLVLDPADGVLTPEPAPRSGLRTWSSRA